MRFDAVVETNQVETSRVEGTHYSIIRGFSPRHM